MNARDPAVRYGITAVVIVVAGLVVALFTLGSKSPHPEGDRGAPPPIADAAAGEGWLRVTDPSLLPSLRASVVESIRGFGGVSDPSQFADELAGVLRGMLDKDITAVVGPVDLERPKWPEMMEVMQSMLDNSNLFENAAFDLERAEVHRVSGE